MILSIYITLAIIGISTMYVAIFRNRDIANMFLWPVALIIFSALFFGSYNIQIPDTVLIQENRTAIDENHTQIDYTYEANDVFYTEPGISWLWLGLCLICMVLFTWDMFAHLKDSYKNSSI